MTGHWLPDLVTAALGHDADLPRLAQPAEVVGETDAGAVLAAGMGDNMEAALGLGLQPGDVAASIGTSGTVFAVSEAPSADPSGAVAWFADATATPENLARNAVEGVLGSLADAIDLLAECGVGFQHQLLIGGGARSAAIREIAPGIFGRDAEVPEPAEYVALGAERQAAWALAGTREPPDWPRPPARRYAGEPQPELRKMYAALRNATLG